MHRALVFVAVLVMSGCAAPAEVEGAAASHYPRTSLRYELVAEEVQAAGVASGQGVSPEDSCAAIQSERSNFVSGNITVAWEPTAPTQRELHLGIIRHDRETGRGEIVGRVEGASPLALKLPPTALETDHDLTFYVGALRSGQVVVMQPYTMALELETQGPVEGYTYSCTVAG